MKVEFKSEGYRDFAQRYIGTYGWYERKSGTPVLVKLTDLDEFNLYFQDKVGMKYKALADAGNFFSFIPVIKGCYFYSGIPVLIKRIPAKQYRRGICDDNTSITAIGDNFALDVTFSIMESIFSGKLETGLEEFRTGYIGKVILDRMFVISFDKIYLYDIPIGNYNWTTRQIDMENSLFKQEVEDCIRDANLEIVVV